MPRRRRDRERYALAIASEIAPTKCGCDKYVFFFFQIVECIRTDVVCVYDIGNGLNIWMRAVKIFKMEKNRFIDKFLHKAPSFKICSIAKILSFKCKFYYLLIYYTYTIHERYLT